MQFNTTSKTLHIALLLVLPVLAAPPVCATSKELSTKNNEAVLLIKAKKYQEAISILEKVIKADPSYELPKENLSICLNNVGLELTAAGKLSAAYASFCKSYFLDSSNAQTKSNLDTVVQMMKKNPKSFADQIALGKSALKAHDVETAIVSFEAATQIKADPKIESKLKSLLASHPRPKLKHEERPDWNPFVECMQDWVKSAWNPPRLDHSNSCIVSWKVFKDGTITNVRVTKKSDHPELDRSCTEAVTFSAPFHALPKNAPKEIDVDFTFDYNVWSQSRKKELDHAKSVDPSVKPATFNPLESESGKLYLKGKEYFTNGDYDSAIGEFRVALEKSFAFEGLPVLIRGHLADALLKKSKDHFQSGNIEKTIECIRQALAMEPDREALRDYLNVAIVKSGKDANSFDTRVAMAEELLGANEIDQAANEYKTAFKLKADEGVRLKIVEVTKMQKASETANKWKYYLEKVPNSVDGHLGLALALIDMKRNEAARKELDQVLQLDPRNQTALSRRSSLEASAEKKD